VNNEHPIKFACIEVFPLDGLVASLSFYTYVLTCLLEGGDTQDNKQQAEMKLQSHL